MSKLIVQSLQNLYGLTPNEAKALFHIMEERRVMNKSEITKILIQKECCGSKQTGYNTIKELERKKVLIEMPGKEKLYRPIDPRQLFKECRKGLAKLEADITKLEIISEPYDYKDIDPRPHCYKIKQEHEIIATIWDFWKNKDFNVKFIYKDKKIDFWNEIKEHFDTNPIKGLFNCVIIQNKKKTEKSSIILLTKRMDKDGMKFFGMMILDPELIKIFDVKKKVKK